ncbi:MAG: hypothetical protein JXB19_04750 [Bacteroidales bacterium]|nr:hypothetical protein [Bacteroidales bacterium]
METLINNYQTLEVYWEYSTGKLGSMKEAKELLPDCLVEIIDKGETIKPWHCDHELLKNLFVKRCRKFEPQFKLDEDCEPVINKFCQYMRKDPAFLTHNKKYSFEKGILLRGRIGCGKTLIMRAASDLLQTFESFIPGYKEGHTPLHPYYKTTFEVVEVSSVTEKFIMRGYEGFYKSQFDHNNSILEEAICFDDLGSEPCPVSYYSNSIDLIGEILMKRYKSFKETGRPVTFATSNLDVKNLKEFYNERVFPRMRELFNDIVLSGNDRRE